MSKFIGENAVVTTTKTGITTERTEKASEFKARRGLKGQAAKKAFELYIKTNSPIVTANMIEEVKREEMKCIGKKTYKSGMTHYICAPKSYGECAAPKPRKSAKQKRDEAHAAEIAALKAQIEALKAA